MSSQRSQPTRLSQASIINGAMVEQFIRRKKYIQDLPKFPCGAWMKQIQLSLVRLISLPKTKRSLCHFGLACPTSSVHKRSLGVRCWMHIDSIVHMGCLPAHL